MQYYIRYYLPDGFVDLITENPDLRQHKSPKNAYRITLRAHNNVRLIVNGKEKLTSIDTSKANYYIGEILTLKDALAGKIDKNSVAYKWLINGVEKEMLLTPSGTICAIDKNGTILSPSDFDENGYYIGDANIFEV